MQEVTVSAVNFNEVNLISKSARRRHQSHLKALHPTFLQRSTAATNASSTRLISSSDMALGAG